MKNSLSRTCPPPPLRRMYTYARNTWREIIVARQITAFRCYPREGEEGSRRRRPLAAFGREEGARCPLCSRGSQMHRDAGIIWAGRQRNRGDLPIKIFCLVGLNSFLEGVARRWKRVSPPPRACVPQQQILFVAAAGREKERGKFQLKKKESLTTRPSFPFAALSLLPSLFLSGWPRRVSRSEEEEALAVRQGKREKVR